MRPSPHPVFRLGRSGVAALTLLLVSVGGLPSAVMAANPRTPTWKTTFSHPDISAIAGGKRVLLVAAGTGSSAATGALVAAFRRGGLELVMDASSLGSVEGLADDAIVTKAARLPVERVVVVRVFGDSVVVTVYGMTGDAKSALSAKRGVVVDVKRRAAGRGVTLKAGHGPTVKTSSPRADLSKARRTYADRAIYWRGGLGFLASAQSANGFGFKTATRDGMGSL